MDINHSKVVRQKTTKSELGNGLVATKGLKVGDVIIKIKEPLLVTVEQDALEKICSSCLIEPESSTESSTLKKCAACKVVRYCSSKCQKADWKLNGVHKNECSLLTKLPSLPPTPVRALYQYLLRDPSRTTLDSRSAGLESHIEDLKKNQKRWDEIVMQARAAINFSKNLDSKTDMVINLLCIMSTNAFRVTLPDDTPIGLCYEPTLALANHSCQPNAFIVFDGRSIYMRALDRIKEGEDIFISYIDVTPTVEIRRAELQQRYFFNCMCNKCSMNQSPYQSYLEWSSRQSTDIASVIAPQVAHAHSMIQSMQEFDKELQALEPSLTTVYDLIDLSKAAASPKQRLSLLKQAMEDLSFFSEHQFIHLPPYPAVLDEIYMTYVENDYLLSALTLLLFINRDIDGWNWPQINHPVVVTRQFTIARLLKYTASLEPSTVLDTFKLLGVEPLAFVEIDWIDATHAFLILVANRAPHSHGFDSRFMRQVQEELREVEEVQVRRGDQGKNGRILKDWQNGGGRSIEGIQLSTRIFESVRNLGSFMFDVIENQTV